MGRLLAELKRRGVLDHTILIITSDHGEEFGEHRHVGHSNGLHMDQLGVVLLIRWPSGIPANVRVPVSVSTRQLAPTVLDLLGIDDERFPGASLARFWADSPTGSASVREPPAGRSAPLLSERRSVGNSLLVGNLHYIAYKDGSDELFDVCSDPKERSDLSDLPEEKETIDRLRARLEELLAELDHDEPPGSAAADDGRPAIPAPQTDRG